MGNGTLSLALKHRLAYADLLRRGLPAALVLEDDATVPPDLWAQLARLAIPPGFAVFYLGSYSARMTTGTLGHEPLAPPARVGLARSTPVHVRRNCSVRALRTGTSGLGSCIVGANAYVVSSRGASELLDSPLRLEADLALSLLLAEESPKCGRLCSCGLRASPPHGAWEWAGRGGGSGRHAPPSGPSSACRLPWRSAPQPQYGPARWLIGQDLHGAQQKTHW